MIFDDSNHEDAFGDPGQGCFYCGKPIDPPFIEWHGLDQTQDVFASIQFHPGCAVEFTIRLLRDVHEYECANGKLIECPGRRTAIGLLKSMPSFPADPMVRQAVSDDVLELVRDEHELLWLVRRVTQLYGEWPGLSEVRAVYCSKYKPRDGVEAYSGVYPDGIPSEVSPDNDPGLIARSVWRAKGQK